jgi:tetratricopeptide (TPR) repeat protein
MNIFRSLLTTAFLLTFLAFGFGCSGRVDTIPVSASENTPSRTSREIERAENLIERSPQSAAGYVSLAAAYIKLGRETGDLGFNMKAQGAIDRGLAVARDDQDLKKLNATLMLSGHRFADALALGKELELASPNDPYVLGILTDANIELGNYSEGAAYAQRLVDIRPDSRAYARVAHIRSLYGDHEGAVKLYKMAANTADPADLEAQSWCLVQLGNEYWRAGKYAESERVNDEALQILPSYHHALFGKGRVLASRGDLRSAVTFLEKGNSMEAAILLLEAYTRLGDAKNARRYSDKVQSKEALGEHFDEHRLAHYWADNGVNLDEALEIAQADYAVQKDIYASDTLAWCLYKKGRLAEAKKMITKAMRLGTRDAKLFYHAGMIERALGNRPAAKRYLDKALRINPMFDLRQADIAREILKKL